MTEFENHEDIRGAKEALSKVCKSRKYHPARDQLAFTRKIDVYDLISKSRSFRKFVKCVTGLTYDDMEILNNDI